MINLLTILLPYLFLFYIIDCFIFLKPFQRALGSFVKSTFHLKKSGIQFVGLLPSNRLYTLFSLPVFYADTGIFIWKRKQFEQFDLYLNENFHYLAYDKITGIKCTDSQIIFNDQLSIDTYYPPLGISTVEKIQTLIKSKKAKRSEHLKQLMDDRHNLRAIRSILETPKKIFSYFEWLGLTLFVLLFILIPIQLFCSSWIYLELSLINVIIVYLSIAVLGIWYKVKEKKHHGSIPVLIFSLIFSPVTAIRIIPLLTKYQLIAFDPAAAAAALLSPDSLNDYLSLELRRLHFSGLKTNNIMLYKCITRKSEYLRSFLPKENSHAEEDILKAPEKKDHAAFSYCPFCHVEFVRGITDCPDCDIPLSPYSGE